MNQNIFRDLRLVAGVVSVLYTILSLYPLAERALLAYGAATSKISLFDEMLLILLDMLSGIDLIMFGGWFDFVLMYSGLSFGVL